MVINNGTPVRTKSAKTEKPTRQPSFSLADTGRLGVRPAALTLKEWFTPAKLGAKPDWTSTGLQKLANSLEDLAREDGAWTALQDEFDELAEEATAAMEQRLRGLFGGLVETHGIAAAAEVLQVIRRSLDAARQRLGAESAPRWNGERSRHLEALAARLRPTAAPKSLFWRAVHGVRPSLSATRWLSRAQQTFVRAQVLPAWEQAQWSRRQTAIQAAQRRVYERLLGTTAEAGLLDHLSGELKAWGQPFRKVASLCQQNMPRLPHSTTLVQLIEALDTVVDPGVIRLHREI